ncbi:hypothetical protein PDN43_14370 [Bacillus cereus]|nr:hypothetical protein [Bacillus cereus]MDA2306077.1 hypothetical protein [Bacillus cereus]
MATKFKFKKSKNHNPFPQETIQERYAKEKAINPRSHYTVDKLEDGYLIFKSLDNKSKK